MATSWLDTNSTKLNNNFKPVGKIEYVNGRIPGSKTIVPSSTEISNAKAKLELGSVNPKNIKSASSDSYTVGGTEYKINPPKQEQPTSKQPTSKQPISEKSKKEQSTSKQPLKSNPTNDYNYTMGLISKNPDAINELVNKKAFNLSNPAVAAAITDFYSKQTANEYAKQGNNPNSGNVVTNNGSSEQDYSGFSDTDWSKPTPFDYYNNTQRQNNQSSYNFSDVDWDIKTHPHAYDAPLPAEQAASIDGLNRQLNASEITQDEYNNAAARALNVSKEHWPIQQDGLAGTIANANGSWWDKVKNWYNSNVNTPENRAAAEQRYQEQINQISGNSPRY